MCNVDHYNDVYKGAEMSFNSVTVIKYANKYLRYLIRRRSLTPTQDKLFA